MEREILFRGKRIDNGEWVEGYYAKSGGSFILQDNGLTYGGFEMFEVSSDTVCQYTGLTDKNGKKIFEWDIIKCSKKLFKIVWVQECAHFATHPMERLSWSPCMNVATVKAAEAAGNIFDNPEFLEGGAE